MKKKRIDKYTVPLWQTGLIHKIGKGHFICRNFLKVTDRTEKFIGIHKMQKPELRVYPP